MTMRRCLCCQCNTALAFISATVVSAAVEFIMSIVLWSATDFTASFVKVTMGWVTLGFAIVSLVFASREFKEMDRNLNVLLVTGNHSLGGRARVDNDRPQPNAPEEELNLDEEYPNTSCVDDEDQNN